MGTETSTSQMIVVFLDIDVLLGASGCGPWRCIHTYLLGVSGFMIPRGVVSLGRENV